MPQDKIIIGPNTTQLDCEKLVALLSGGRQYALELPGNVDKYGVLGLESSIISLIVAWARYSKTPEIHLPITSSQKKRYLSALCQTSYGLTALALSKVIRTNEGAAVSVKEVKDLISRRLAEFDQKNLNIFAAEEGVSFLSIYDIQKEYGKWLYAGAAEPTNLIIHTPDQISDWLSKLMMQLVPKKFTNLLDQVRLNSIGAATYELLENAFHHGRLDEYADPIDVGVCGVAIKVINATYADTNLVASGNRDVHLYFARRLLKDKAKERLFFEITVFDSGIGYHRWINAPCNKDAISEQFRGKSERTTVKACLLKHATSKRSDGSGVGLFRVLRLMKELFGFIRIRTGKTCFYSRLDLTDDRTFRELGALGQSVSSAAVELKDWFPGEKLPEASGTSVTLCIPLTRWS